MSCTAECTSNRIALNWSKLRYADDSEFDCYIVKYRIKKTKKFTIEQIYDRSKKSILLDGLKADTDYEIKVYVSADGDETRFFEKTVRTEMSMSRALMILSEKKDTDGENLDIYQMQPEIIMNLANHVRCCNMISGYDRDKHIEKTIMLLGETGSGKSTLIDAMFNYIAGVSLVDDYRFKLVNLTKEEKVKIGKQNESQTNGITCYRIPWKDGSKIDCKLCVVDTPGFNDTRGPGFDEQISEMVKNLFQKGIKSLDALCLVVNVTRVRITDREMYVFSSILELFAKDISDNIFLFLTHDDGATGVPTIMQSLRKSDIPIKNSMYFRFNNANLFKIEHSTEVWKAKDNNFSRFFDKLLTTPSISLSNTKAVLDSKAFLEMQLMKIQKTIGNQVTDIMNIKQDKEFIAKHEKDIENNKDFTKTYEVNVPIKVPHTYESMNCTICSETCHEDCSVPAGMFIWTCEAMTSFKCGICRGKCSTDHHTMEKFTHETKTETRTETREELKKRYEVAKQGAAGRTEMMTKNKASLEQSLKELDTILKQVDEKIVKLKKVALRPNFKSMEDFLNKVIARENRPPIARNFHERVKILTTIKTHVLSYVSLTAMMKNF